MTLSKRTIANMSAQGRPRHVVLTLQTEIAQALADGLTLSELWRQLHKEGAFVAGYDRFRRLVRKLITHPARRTPRAPITSAGASRPAKPVGSAGFDFNPNAKVSDLL